MRISPKKAGISGALAKKRDIEATVSVYYDEDKKGTSTTELAKRHKLAEADVESALRQLEREKRIVRVGESVYPMKAAKAVYGEIKANVKKFIEQWHDSKGEGCDPVFIMEEYGYDFDTVMRAIEMLKEEDELVVEG